MMTSSSYRLFRMQFPEIGLGEIDARCARWRDIASHNGSFAYEIGRMLARDPPREDHGIMIFSKEAERAIKELWGGS